MVSRGLATAGPGRPGAVAVASRLPSARARYAGQTGEEIAHADPVTTHPLGRLVVGIPRVCSRWWTPISGPTDSSGKSLSALTGKAAVRAVHACRRDGACFSIAGFAVSLGTAENTESRPDVLTSVLRAFGPHSTGFPGAVAGQCVGANGVQSDLGARGDQRLQGDAPA